MMPSETRDPDGLFEAGGAKPLADILRPKSLGEVLGQGELLKPDSALGQMIKVGHIASLILWGPPGSGKTTIARLLAQSASEVRKTPVHFVQISAVFSGVADLRKAFAQAQERRAAGGETLLFVDEIHRFNKAQQDGFLPYVENGTITLVGATTENPSFELNGALLSRCRVLVVERLDEPALNTLIERAEVYAGKKIPVDADARQHLAQLADGDGRYLLNLVESLLQLHAETKPLDREALSRFVQRRAPLYDKDREGHYNLISALHKSLRGSDPDAALYWFARMLNGGEDPNYIARRLLRFAAEDVGLAAPQALPLAVAAWQSYERLGSPEGDLALAELVVFLAVAPKSNAVYRAFGHARRVAGESGSAMPPAHILNAPTDLMKDLGYGKGYEYDHDAEGAFSGQNYFPESLERHQFYRPTNRGREAELQTRLARWEELRAEKSKGEKDK